MNLNNAAKNLLLITISALATWILLINGCKETPEIETKTETKVVYKYINKEVKTTPNLIKLIDTEKLKVFDTLVFIDTQRVILDYYSAKIFSDSIKDDSISISIQDTIFKNSILGRSVRYTLKYPTIYINTKETIKTKPRGLFLSGSIGNQYFGGVTFVNGKYFGSVQYGNGGLLLGGGYKIF